MDTLALLCNLYGDGPQTLRRLREAGCGTLAALETVESERLASLLRTSVRSAKRFQAEGRLLRERSELSGERAPSRRPSEEPAAQYTPPPNPLVASVLTAWRERDAVAGEMPSAARAALAVEPPRTSARAGVETRQGLSGLDGMDAELHARLREAGVATLEALRAVDVLDLAGRGVAGYTRLLHLQFLARRAVECRPAGSAGAGATTPDSTRVGTGPAARLEGPATGEGADRGPETLQSSTEGVPRSAAGTLAGTDPGASTAASEGDLLVPVRPPERRGMGRPAAVPTIHVVQRFSPRVEPQMPLQHPLEAELERHATGRTSAEALGLESGAPGDAGSSGPFA